MEEKCANDTIDDIMLPGFRFHPTDEELVGFYLKRKIQQQPLPIELIKQVDIYKYDPWDLPKLCSTGEKEWYFYCPRDRKYRNSVRPNRVTGAGFWKATGTDRPIYSSAGTTKCIGLKKSLVFYRGKAAKGIKTDWMMHEFRLPSLSDQSSPNKKIFDKTLPPNDSWAICRIFKKTNSNAQRTLSHSWVSSVTETTPHDIFTQGVHSASFSSESISCTSETGSTFLICSNNGIHQASASFPALDIPSDIVMNPTVYKSSLFTIPNGDLQASSMFSSFELSGSTTKNTVDVGYMVFNSPSQKISENIDFEGSQQFNGFSTSSTQDIQGSIGTGEEEVGFKNNQFLPFSLPPNLPVTWKPCLPWDSPSYPSEMSTTYPEKSYSTGLN